ncbi:MAG: thioredoxin family protein [Phycisphaerales bacterium]
MKSGTWVLVVFVVALVGIAGWKFMRPPAPTPAVFAQGTTLASMHRAIRRRGQARARGHDRGLVCPCQAYKRGALADERVQALIEAKTIPVYINFDDQPEDVRMLGVAAVPTTCLIRDGKVVERFRGGLSTSDMLEWLGRVTRLGVTHASGFRNSPVASFG